MSLCIYVFLAASYRTMDYGNVTISALSEKSAWRHLLDYMQAQDKQAGNPTGHTVNADTIDAHFTLFTMVPVHTLSDGSVIGTNLPLEAPVAS